MIPIICVGESDAQRDRGVTEEFISLQLKEAFSGVDAADAKRCVVAYEPIWAIGTGRTATPEEAQQVCAHIRSFFKANYGAAVARAVRVLYGGSMNAGNAASLLACPDIDGGLIGGASLKSDDFTAIVKAAQDEK